MKYIILALALCITAGISSATEPDEILSQHFKAIGQEKVVKLKGFRNTGKAMLIGMEFPYTSYFQRPGKYRLEVQMHDSKMIQAFDGHSAWMIAPGTGSSAPRELTGPELRSMAIQASIDGLLYEYSQKGIKPELMGTEDMDGREVFKMKLVLDDEQQVLFYIDSKTYLLLRQDHLQQYHGSLISTEAYYSDYKEIGGMVLPFGIEIRAGGQSTMKLIIDAYQFNPEVEDSLFTKPSGK